MPTIDVRNPTKDTGILKIKWDNSGDYIFLLDDDIMLYSTFANTDISICAIDNAKHLIKAISLAMETYNND